METTSSMEVEREALCNNVADGNGTLDVLLTGSGGVEEQNGHVEEEEEWVEDLLHLAEADLDLYKVLHVPNGRLFNVDRARSSYHRLSFRYHPMFGRKASQRNFCELTLAYNTLKDEERRRIYDQHGVKTLFKSEQYMDPSIFEIDPFAFYDDFYNAIDPADKEYFLLNGTDATHPSDSEESEEEEEQEEDEEQDDNSPSTNEAGVVAEDEEDVPKVELSETEMAAALERAKQIESKGMPTPPVSVLVSSAAFTPKDEDVFAQIAQISTQPNKLE